MASNYPLIPDEAFLYFPNQSDIVQNKNGHLRRIIFDGGVHFSLDEIKKIADLREEMNKKDKNSHIQSYPDNTLLRFLQANQFNNTNCIKALRQYKAWQEKSIPIRLTAQIQKLLKEGILYISGRDYRYRPIIVVNVGKILDLKPKEKLFMETLGYFFQFVIENFLIQGQVENWVTIIDLGNASVFSLGGTLVDTIAFLSNNFRARVHHSFLINAPSSIKFVWGMVKGVMNEDQLKKLTLLSKKQLDEDNFDQINKSQVQKKYGGTKQNMTVFWPLSQNYDDIRTVKSSLFSLISVEQYNKKYMNKELPKRKVNQKYIDNKKHTPLVQKSAITLFNRESGSNYSGNNDLTRSQVSDDLNELNSRIPKQRVPPQVPVIAESTSFADFIESFFKRLFS